MSGFDDDTVRMTPAAWGAAPAVRHAYPLAVRDPSMTVAIGLMMRSLPYAAARFGVLLATSVAVLVWLAVAFGGAAWLGTHIAAVFGWVWAIGCLGVFGFVWGTVLRYLLHLIECGHVAVLTELITRGALPAGEASQFAYGKRVVVARIGQETLLYGLNALVRGIVASLHRTLDWVGSLLPIPGLEGVSRLVDIVLKGATRYLDKVVFSYTLARGDADPWTASREGLVYYAQNARPVLTTAIWSVVLERVLTAVLFLVLLVPAAGITVLLPHAMRETGGVVVVLVALLLAGPLRAAFVKPVFLIMMMVRFHAAIEGQAINAEWDGYLANASQQFRELGAEAAGALGRSRYGRGLV